MPEPAALLFVENVGQFDARARFQVRGAHTSFILAADALWLTWLAPTARAPVDAYAARARPTPLSGVHLKLSFVGAAAPRLEPFDRASARISYLRGADSRGWVRDVPVWRGVRYRDLYPGIDLELRGAGGVLQPRLVARPGAALGAVRLRVEGGQALAVRGERLEVATRVGVVELPLPVVEMPAGAPLAGLETPRVRGDEVRAPFAAQPQGAVPPAQAGADLSFSTLLGGSGGDYGHGIAVDQSGAAYIVMSVASADFPATPGAFDRAYGAGTCGASPNTYPCNDVAVAKLAPDGSGLIYATFLGGGSDDTAGGIALDSSGAAYVTGYTTSTDFPTTPGALDRTYTNTCSGFLCHDGFVAKLNPSGSALTYSTYLGGGNDDGGNNIAVDAGGAAYVAGHTYSTNFPTTSAAFDRSYNGADDGFVAKLNPSGSALVYSSFIGGTDRDCYYCDIGIDANGSAYITGWTTSSDFPTTANAFDRTFGGSSCPHLCDDAFVAKINPSGSALVYSTFLGGADGDGGNYVAVDGLGAAYVAGYTYSTNFPTTPGALARSLGGGADSFIVKLNPSGSALTYATYLGGSHDDSVTSIARQATGAIYLTGSTASANFPTTPGVFDPTYGGGVCGAAPATYPCYDAFVARLNSAGSALTYSTYLGGSADDTAAGIAIDNAGDVYVTGSTASANFPTTPGAFSRSLQGGADGFVTKVAPPPAPTYRISGVVRDTHGTPIAEVTITTNTGVAARTNSAGAYTIAGLLDAPYILTPQRLGYSFAPASRSVSLPPDATNQNFTATPRPPGPLFIPLVGRSSPNCNDIEDANDEPANNPPALSPLGVACYGSLQDDPVGEDDWYWVNLPAGRTIRVDLGGIEPGADYNLYLFDFALGASSRIGRSENPGQADEHLEYTNRGAGAAQVYIRIRIASKAPAPPNLYLLRAVIG